MNYPDLISCDGWFVSVEGMRDDLAVLEDGVWAGRFTVYADVSPF
jgi:hypothetical protein